ncbi:MAG: helix-turn-helix domain-containing protein [Armatimonadetes bacterium]|nr:helix-turn-helix domain-containing protein [Armatimonadota bacterium]
MRLDDWLKYVEQVEKDQDQQTAAPSAPPAEKAEKPKESTGSVASEAAARKEALFGSRKPVSDQGAQTVPPVSKPASSPASVSGSNAETKTRSVEKPGIASVSEAAGRLNQSEEAKLASSQEVVARPAPPASKTQPLHPDDLNLHIPEIEDFLPYLKTSDSATEPDSPQAKDRAEQEKPQTPDSGQPAFGSPEDGGSQEPDVRAPAAKLPAPSASPASAPKAAQPRPRPAETPAKQPVVGSVAPGDAAAGADAVPQSLETLPRHIQALARIDSDKAELLSEVAQKSYKRDFRESRSELLERLLDPPLSLEDAARILNVCPTTVRRYTNRGVLPHFRTVGNQRRFRLSDVIAFMENHGERLSRRKRDEPAAPTEH